jgi:predicted transcriptional regulator
MVMQTLKQNQRQKPRSKKEKEPQRDKYEIIKALLEAMPGQKLRLMYKANLDFNRTKIYLPLILKEGLADFIHERYFVSKKGKEYLDVVNELLRLQGQ